MWLHTSDRMTEQYREGGIKETNREREREKEKELSSPDLVPPVS